MNFAVSELREMENMGLLRKLTLTRDSVLNFSSNDYLNLSGDPHVKECSIKAVERYGTGAGGSRLMTGNLPLHEELEDRLAELTGMESALVYGSGFLANIGVTGALAGRNDVIYADRLNHASLVDGATGSRARVRRYRHLDTGQLQEMLESERSTGRRIMVTDSLFSMDGDIAPLAELRELADRYGCLLMVDEAHAIGVYGGGGGLCRKAGVRADLITGTLSKSLGSYGGFAACGRKLREFLVNRSRSFIYTTGLPPAATGAAMGALDILRREPGLGSTLLKRASVFREALKGSGISSTSRSQIIPVVTGTAAAAISLSAALESRGIMALAIRPPTVPDNTSRIRFSITLALSPDDLVWVASLVGRSL